MAEVVVIGAGLSGTLMAYELLPQLRKDDRLTRGFPGTGLSFRPLQPLGRDRLAQAQRYRDRPRRRHEAQGHPPADAGRAARASGGKPHRARRTARSIDYDYLVVATGPELAFDEIPGLGSARAIRNRSATSITPSDAKEAFEKLAANPGPVVIGAVQGASCFGPAYEFLFILETELRRRKLRDRVPMTFVTSEPYIGHLGLDGVGDTKGLLESEMREKHIKWITNARVKSVEQGKMIGRGSRRGRLGPQDPRIAVRLFDDAARLSRRRRGSRHREADQSARLRHRRQAPAQSGLSKRVRASASAWRSRRSARRRFRWACRKPAS